MAVVDQTDIAVLAATTCRVEVSRRGRDDAGGGRVDAFDVPVHEGMTLLDALCWIRLHRDPTLSLRHSCLHASCGTCGMRVDGREELACVCALADHGDTIRVAPLENLPAVSDLVVEMGPFYDRLPAEHPLIRVSDAPPDARPPAGHAAYGRLEDCIECALCFSACPVAGSDFVGPAALHAAHRLLQEPRGAAPGDVLAWAARPEGAWQCTTCRACVDACPVGIAPLDAIVDLRRALVERGEIEPLLAQTLQKVARQGNAYGKSAQARARWTRELDFAIADARTEPVQYVWFVGDDASFDERVQHDSQRLARILHGAGVSFGLLYDGERNAGNDVRRVGDEGLFEMLAKHNMAVLAGVACEALFTTDPHSLNTLRNEYPRYGLDTPVYHHTELLLDLVRSGRLALRAALAGTRVTYHDPCYLARYNAITDAPRALIAATGAELVEMPRHGAETFCCGAGGGRIWMSDSGSDLDTGRPPSEQRIREAQTLGDLAFFVVSCPKDLTMYTAAAQSVGGADFEVIELTALLEYALAGSGLNLH